MKAAPKVGDTSELTFTVDQTHVIDFADEHMPAVLSTPTLIGFLERTARQTIAPLLEDREKSVGVQIEVRHLAPTPIGQQVTCRARVIHVDGAIVSFHIEARDERERIARGSHKRAVVKSDRFAARVKRKTK